MRKHIEHKTGQRGLAITLMLALALAFVLLAGCGRPIELSTDRETYTPEDFSAVNLSLDIGEVTFHTGDQFFVEVERVNYPELQVEVVGGTLTITEVPGSFNLRGNSSCKVDITVPSGTELDLVSLEIDAGEIEATDVTASQVGISVDAGSIVLNDATTDLVELEVDAGSIAVAGFAGLEDANVSLEVDAGDVEYLGSSQGTKYTQSGPGATLTATVDAGEIEVRA